MALKSRFHRFRYTLAPHGHPHNWTKPWILRHRLFHGPRYAWTLRPEAHAAETVKQLPIQTSSQSLQCIHPNMRVETVTYPISKGYREDAKQIRLMNGLRLCPNGQKTWDDVTCPQAEGRLCAMIERSRQTGSERAEDGAGQVGVTHAD